MAGVGFSLVVIDRLLKSFPGTVVGLKDSSGDWKNTEALLKSFPGFEVFPGSETYLLDALRLGGAGCISATANVNVAAMRRLIDTWRLPDSDADAAQAKLSAVRAAIQKYPLVSANKAILAAQLDDPLWNTVRPPLSPLSAQQTSALHSALEALAFRPPTDGAGAVGFDSPRGKTGTNA
jgi:4-hydroxy-tetrahydrodipicolinate synthase